MQSDAACPFCPPPDDRLIVSSELAVALWDGFPVSPGHALVIPRRHVASWFEATRSERSEMLELLDSARAAVLRDHAPSGWNVGMNLGRSAGQTVPHLHLHLIPRYDGDAADPRGGVRWVLPDRADYWSDR